MYPSDQLEPQTGARKLRVPQATQRLVELFLRAKLRFMGLPAFAQVLLVFAASRVWGWFVFSTVARQQLTSPWGSGPLSYAQFLSIWDAGWYEKIAVSGYPQHLPHSASGVVEQNQWAFMPAYPMVSGGLAKIFDVSYMSAAIGVALISGFIAAWVIYLLFKESLAKTNWQEPESVSAASAQSSRHTLALWAVAVFGFAPVSAVLQIPYAESFNLIFLAASLLFLLRSHYILALPFALIACLSRPIGVPLGATFGLWWAWTVFTESGGTALSYRKLATSFKKHLVQLVCALAVCAFALLWPLIAWMRTGEPDAYTATETAWRGSHLYLFAPWIEQSKHYLGVFGPLLLAALVVAFFGVLLSPLTSRTLAPALRLWCASFAVYLLLFWFPQSSTFRMMLPLFVLVLPLVALSTSRAYRALLITSGAVLQAGWVGWLWHWKQLPGGGDYPP
ncbi:hypothetical protein ACIP5Z_00220 [Rothia terrae]|uniref:hypothetical protein n=1 Tax=Rothia terrae TaxID=396015 RepID=UPI0037F7772D